MLWKSSLTHAHTHINMINWSMHVLCRTASNWWECRYHSVMADEHIVSYRNYTFKSSTWYLMAEGRIERVASVRLQIQWSRVDLEKISDDEVCIHPVTITITFLCTSWYYMEKERYFSLLFLLWFVVTLFLELKYFCFKKNHDTSPEKSFLPRQDSDDLGFSPPVGSPKKPTSESAVYDIQIRLPVSTSWMFDFPVCWFEGRNRLPVKMLKY